MNIPKLGVIYAGLLLFSASCLGHGAGSVKGEWLPVLSNIKNDKIMSQVQYSPLGSEILVEYSGEGFLEILADDDVPFIRISEKGVEGNYDHPRWHESQVAGGRPLPESVLDGQVNMDWRLVSKVNYYGWYDNRLEKNDDHQTSWDIKVRVNGNDEQISGSFKSLTEPQKRTLVTLNRKETKIPKSLQVMLIPDVEPAIRLAYQGEETLIVTDQQGEEMLRFSDQGVEANMENDTWLKLGRVKSGVAKGWFKVSDYPAYTWPDKRLYPSSEASNWSISLDYAKDRNFEIVGSWVDIPLKGDQLVRN